MKRKIKTEIEIPKTISLKKIEFYIVGLTNITFERLMKEKDSVLKLYMTYSNFSIRQNGMKDGRVWINYSFVKDRLNWSKRKYDEAKKRLVELNLIKPIMIKNKDTGNILRHDIELKHLPVFAMINNNKNDDNDFQHHHVEDVQNDTTIKNKHITINNSKSIDDKSSIKEINKKYLPIAKLLSKIILKNKNMTYTDNQLSKWSDDIRKLNTLNKVSIKRIKNAVKWYKKNIGKEYVPVIESGISLRNKFMKLENAMKRDSDYNSDNKNNKMNDLNPKVTEIVLDNFDIDDKQKLINNLDTINNWIHKWENVLKKKPNLLGRSPALKRIIVNYCEYLDDQKWLENIDCSLFKYNNSIFKRFIKKYEEGFGFRFETGKLI